MNRMTQDDQRGDGVLILMAYSRGYAPGAICEAANREPLRGTVRSSIDPRYASLRGYDFHCKVLEAHEMLQAVAPRDACTWYKAARSSLATAWEVLLLREAFAEQRHGTMVWIDADALVVDKDACLEDYIEKATRGVCT